MQRPATMRMVVLHMRTDGASDGGCCTSSRVRWPCTPILYASFVLLAQWLSLVVRPRTVPWRALLASGVALAVLLIPMAMFLLSGPHGNIDWIRGSYGRFQDVWNSVRQVLGRGGAIAACGYLVVCLALLAVGVVQMRRAGTPHARWSYLLPFLWFVSPIAIPLAVSLTIKPVLDPRYATICAPAVALLAAAVVGQPGAWRMRLLAVLLAAELFGDWAYFERLRKENWRGVARMLVAESLPGDVAIFYAPYVRRPFDYYASRTAAPPNAPPRIAELYPSARYSDFTLDTVVPLSLAGAVDSARHAPRTWLVLSHMLHSDSACVAALETGMRPRCARCGRSGSREASKCACTRAGRDCRWTLCAPRRRHSAGRVRKREGRDVMRNGPVCGVAAAFFRL